MTTPLPSWYTDIVSQTQQPTVSQNQSPIDNASAAPVPYTPPETTDQQLMQMKNYDKITPFEKLAYGFLPPVAKVWSPVGNAITEIGKTTVGKFIGKIAGTAMSWLNIGADTVERSLGTLSQYAAGGDFKFSDAWNAGSLYYDMMNYPRLVKGPDGHSNLQIPTDLPGVGGLVWARNQLAAGKTIEEVKQSYYNDLGALQLRAMGQDAISQMVLDPLTWFILPALKPVERIHAAAVAALGTKYTLPAVEEAIKTTEGLVKVAEDSKHVEALAHETEALGALNKMRDLIIAGKNPQALKWYDKWAISLAGGDPANPNVFGKGLLGKLNPFNTTPATKVRELADTMKTAFGTTVIAPVASSVAAGTMTAEEAVSKISESALRLSKGSYLAESSGVFLSEEGRLARAVATGFESQAIDAATAWKTSAAPRELIDDVSRITGRTYTEVQKAITQDATGIFREVQTAAHAAALAKDVTFPQKVIEKLADGSLTAEKLMDAAKMFDMSGPTRHLISFDPWVVHFLGQLETEAYRKGITMYEVAGEGLVNRWSNALKSAETLAFIRMNPANAVRNAINNEVTMLARGAFGFISPKEIDSYWKTVGYVPSRLAQAFGVGADMNTEMSEAEKLLQEAVSGGKNGAPEKIRRLMRGIELGKFDFAKISNKFELSASRRAYTNGTLRYLAEYARPPSLDAYLTVEEAAALRRVNPDLPSLMEGAWIAARGSEAKMEKILQGNLRLNATAVIKELERKMGTAKGTLTVEDVLGSDVIQHINETLPDAMKNGTIEQWARDTKNIYLNHVRESRQAQLAKFSDELANRVCVGGNYELQRQEWGVFDMRAGVEEGAIRAQQETLDLANSYRAKGDNETARKFIANMFSSQQDAYNNMVARQGEILDAIQKGFDMAQERALAQGKEISGVPDMAELRSKLDTINTKWNEFNATRQSELQKIFDGNEDYAVALKKYYAATNKAYKEVAQAEAKLSAKMDEALVKSIDNKAISDRMLNLRSDIRALVTENRNLMMKASQDAALEMDPVARDEIWKKALAQRIKNLNKINGQNGITAVMDAAFDGDPVALMLGTKQSIESTGRKMPPRIIPEGAGPEESRNALKYLDAVDKRELNPLARQSAKVNEEPLTPPKGQLAGPKVTPGPEFHQTAEPDWNPNMDFLDAYRGDEQIYEMSASAERALTPEEQAAAAELAGKNKEISDKTYRLAQIDNPGYSDEFIQIAKKYEAGEKLTPEETRIFDNGLASPDFVKGSIKEPQRFAGIIRERKLLQDVAEKRLGPTPEIRYLPPYSIPDITAKEWNMRIDTLLAKRGLGWEAKQNMTFRQLWTLAKESDHQLAEDFLAMASVRAQKQVELAAIEGVDVDEAVKSLVDAGINNVRVRTIKGQPEEPKFIPKMISGGDKTRMLPQNAVTDWREIQSEQYKYGAIAGLPTSSMEDPQSVSVLIRKGVTRDYSKKVYTAEITGINGGPWRFEMAKPVIFADGEDAAALKEVQAWVNEAYNKIPWEAQAEKISLKPTLPEGKSLEGLTPEEMNNMEGLWAALGHKVNDVSYPLNGFDLALSRSQDRASYLEEVINSVRNADRRVGRNAQVTITEPIRVRGKIIGERDVQKNLGEVQAELDRLESDIERQLKWRDIHRRGDVMTPKQLGEDIKNQQIQLGLMLDKRAALEKKMIADGTLDMSKPMQTKAFDLDGNAILVDEPMDRMKIYDFIKQKEENAWKVAKERARETGKLARDHFKDPLTPTEHMYLDKTEEFFDATKVKKIYQSKLVNKKKGITSKVSASDLSDAYLESLDRRAYRELPYYERIPVKAQKAPPTAPSKTINFSGSGVRPGVEIGTDNRFPDSPLFFTIHEHTQSIDGQPLKYMDGRLGKYYSASIQSADPTTFTPIVTDKLLNSRQEAVQWINEQYHNLDIFGRVRAEVDSHFGRSRLDWDAATLAQDATNTIPERAKLPSMDDLKHLLRQNYLTPDDESLSKLHELGVSDEMLHDYAKARATDLPKPDVEGTPYQKAAQKLHDDTAKKLDAAWGKYDKRWNKVANAPGNFTFDVKPELLPYGRKAIVSNAGTTDIEVAQYQLQQTIEEIQKAYEEGMSALGVPPERFGSKHLDIPSDIVSKRKHAAQQIDEIFKEYVDRSVALQSQPLMADASIALNRAAWQEAQDKVQAIYQDTPLMAKYGMPLLSSEEKAMLDDSPEFQALKAIYDKVAPVRPTMKYTSPEGNASIVSLMSDSEVKDAIHLMAQDEGLLVPTIQKRVSRRGKRIGSKVTWESPLNAEGTVAGALSRPELEKKLTAAGIDSDMLERFIAERRAKDLIERDVTVPQSMAEEFYQTGEPSLSTSQMLAEYKYRKTMKGEDDAALLKKITDAGIPKTMVDEYVAKKGALSTDYVRKALTGEASPRRTMKASTIDRLSAQLNEGTLPPEFDPQMVKEAAAALKKERAQRAGKLEVAEPITPAVGDQEIPLAPTKLPSYQTTTKAQDAEIWKAKTPEAPRPFPDTTPPPKTTIPESGDLEIPLTSAPPPPPPVMAPVPSAVVSKRELAEMLHNYKYQVVYAGGQNEDMRKAILSAMGDGGEAKLNKYVYGDINTKPEMWKSPATNYSPSNFETLSSREWEKVLRQNKKLAEKIRASTGMTDEDLFGHMQPITKTETNPKTGKTRIVPVRSVKIKGAIDDPAMIDKLVQKLDPELYAKVVPARPLPEKEAIKQAMEGLKLPNKSAKAAEVATPAVADAAAAAPKNEKQVTNLVEQTAKNVRSTRAKLNSANVMDQASEDARIDSLVETYRRLVDSGGENLSLRRQIMKSLGVDDVEMSKIVGDANQNIMAAEDVLKSGQLAGIFNQDEAPDMQATKALMAIESYAPGHPVIDDINHVPRNVLRSTYTNRLKLFDNPTMAREQFKWGAQRFWNYTPAQAEALALMHEQAAKSVGMSTNEWFGRHFIGFVQGGSSDFFQSVWDKAPQRLDPKSLQNIGGIWAIRRDGKIGVIPKRWATHGADMTKELQCTMEDFIARGTYTATSDGTPVVLVYTHQGQALERTVESYENLMTKLEAAGVTKAPVFYASETGGYEGTKIDLAKFADTGMYYQTSNMLDGLPQQLDLKKTTTMGTWGITADGKLHAGNSLSHPGLARDEGLESAQAFIERGRYGTIKAADGTVHPFISSDNISGQDAKYVTESWNELQKKLNGWNVEGVPAFYGPGESDVNPHLRNPFQELGKNTVQGDDLRRAGTKFYHQRNNIGFMFKSYNDPNFSSGIHETFHAYVEMLRYMSKETGNPALAARLKAIEDYCGVKAPEDWLLKGANAPHEKGAVAFEHYMRSGRIPAGAPEEVRSLFGQIKQWMKDVYNKIRGGQIDVKLSPQVREAFDEMLLGKTTSANLERMKESSQFEHLVPLDMPSTQALNEMSMHQAGVIDKIAEEAKAQYAKPMASLGDIPPELKDKVAGYLQYAKSSMADARYAADRFGAYVRDASLLNYNRRTNFDAWAANAYPFLFWTTHSISNWAVHSIDRPAMLVNYMRFSNLLNHAGIPEDSVPSRVQGKIRVHLPFVPQWMGDQYIDPMRVILPFENFAQPFQQMQQTVSTAEGRAKRVLDTELKGGQITQEQYDTALKNASGDVWQNAMDQVKANDESMNYDAWDFASAVSSPHAPLVWAIKAMQGHPEQIGPFTPLSKTMKSAAGALGVDWNTSPLNVEGAFRKKLGLPVFDQWDDYKVDRMLSNMTAEGVITSDDAMRAMIDRSGPAFDAASKRAAIEYSGGPVGFLMGLIGLQPTSYPQGEEYQRNLQKQFFEASDTYHKADTEMSAWAAAHPNATQDETMAYATAHPQLVQGRLALQNFFDKHPEYQARLAIFEKPDVRLKTFLTDNLWSTWNALPTLSRTAVKDALGTDFSDMFINKSTRAIDQIPVERLAVWLKLMGGTPPGTMKLDPSQPQKISMPDPVIAQRAQAFYNFRSAYFSNYYKEQDEYFKISAGAGRTQYIAAHPDLKQYWDWRRDYLYRNPDVAPFLIDTSTGATAPTYPTAQAYEQAMAATPNLTKQEWGTIISPSLQGLIADYMQTGNPLPDVANKYLDQLAQEYGIANGATLLNMIETAP
jgi:hypothetical protein